MGKMNVRTKMRNIEFIRIFFAISIVYFHLLHSFMIPFTEETAAYQELALQSRYAKYIVECFFIMSGYFLYRSILADPGQKTLDFVMKKWIRLWPVLAVSTILSVVFLDVSLQEGFLNLFFLQSTGLTTAWTGLNWYISAFFFAEIFYFMMYKAMKNSAAMKFLICLIVTALLAGVNMLTADRIAALAVQTAEDSQKVVLPNAASFEEVDEDTVKGLDGSGQLAGYVITTEAKGYGGTIEVMTGITADGSVSGVVLLSQNETPGLGANATKESFTGQYQQAVPESGFEVIKSGGADDGQIQAMTGATITSQAVTDAVNLAVEKYQTLEKGGN